MAAYQKGLRVRWWDFLFYAVFGLVVTSFVRIAGVLLVFSYLIVPAVCGINLAHANRESLAHRMDHRVARRNRWSVSLLLVGPAVGRSDRLHVRRDADPHFIFRVVAASSRPFWDNSRIHDSSVGRTIISSAAAVSMASSLTIFEDNFSLSR